MKDINLNYSDFKNVANTKGLLWQYTALPNNASPVYYLIYATDDPVSYFTNIYFSGHEPDGSDTTANATNKTDFETNYKPTANQSISKYQQPMVQTTKQSLGGRAWTFSHDFSDKTTWFGDSIRVISEAVGTGTGAMTVFTLAHKNLIDVVHGKLTDEDFLVPTAGQGGTSYIPVVQVAGITKTERPFGAISGSDYVIDYVNGTITFTVAPANGAAVTATYYYSPLNSGSTMYIRPAVGKKTLLTMAECMFSFDILMNDGMIAAVFTYNPALGAPPAKFEYPGSRSRFKRMWDFIAYTSGSFPVVPGMGGPTRGYIKDIYQLRFDYVTAITLDDAYGAEMRVWLENHIPYGGEQAQITFYGFCP